MKAIQIRKKLLVIEDTMSTLDFKLKTRLRRVAAIAVINNPFSGSYVEDLAELVDYGEKLGGTLAEMAVGALEKGREPHGVRSFGKGVIVGMNGELEHGAALIHPKMGKPIREAVHGGKAIIPSTKKIAGPGATIDVPFFFKDDLWSMPYLDAMEVRVSDAPGADEIVVIVAMTDGTRPLARVGGGTETTEQRLKRIGG